MGPDYSSFDLVRLFRDLIKVKTEPLCCPFYDKRRYFYTNCYFCRFQFRLFKKNFGPFFTY